MLHLVFCMSVVAVIEKQYIPLTACTQPMGDRPPPPPSKTVLVGGIEMPDERRIGVEYRIQSITDDFLVEELHERLTARFEALRVPKTVIPEEHPETWGPIAGWEIAERFAQKIEGPLTDAGIIFREFEEHGVLRWCASADINSVDRAVLPYRMYFTKRASDQETLNALTSGLIARHGFNEKTFDLALFLRKTPERLREFYAQESAGQRAAIIGAYKNLAHLAQNTYTPVIENEPGIVTRLQLLVDDHPVAVSVSEIEEFLNTKSSLPLETRLSQTTITQLTPRVDPTAHLYLVNNPLA